MDETQTVEMSVKQALDRKERLKKLIDEVKDIDMKFDELSTDCTLAHLTKLAEKSDAIIAEGCVADRAEHTTEVVLDAQLLKMNHAMMSKLIKQTGFQTQVYTSAIKNLVQKGDDNIKWGNVADLVCNIACTVRVKPSMLGTFEFGVQEKVTKQRQQRERKTLGKEKRPDVVEKLQRSDPGAQRVNMIQAQLVNIFKKNNRQPIPYFKLIIDPNNFMNTVENALHISFLVQSNRVAIESLDDNMPHVRVITSDERVKNQSTTQAICTLNTEVCNKMIRFYNIREPMLTIQEPEYTSAEEDEDVE